MVLTMHKLFTQEWLITNTNGSYASQSIAGANTRKYHGYLVANLPQGKHVILANLEQCLIIDNARHEFGCNHYTPNVIYPLGYNFLTSFHYQSGIRLGYVLKDIKLEKAIILAKDEDSVFVCYKISNNTSKNISLELKPLIANCHFHINSHLQDFTVKSNKENQFIVTTVNNPLMPPVFIQGFCLDKMSASLIKQWYYNFYYYHELERGFAATADYFSPAKFNFLIAGNTTSNVVLVVSLREYNKDEVNESHLFCLDKAYTLRDSVCDEYTDFMTSKLSFNNLDSIVGLLKERVTDFIYRDSKGHYRVCAGYPWFGSWGRDTFIALPGLCLVKKDYDIAYSIMEDYLSHMQYGLIPNYFDTMNTNHIAYNCVDASLWFAWSVKKYLLSTNDYEKLRSKVYPALLEIVKHFIVGTWFNTKVYPNGLLYSGSEDIQVTWMDAKAYGVPVTPRNGFAVEINALWYNLVCLIVELAKDYGDKDVVMAYSGYVVQTKQSFTHYFWNEDLGYFVDVLNKQYEQNKQLRPNQLVAMALDYPLVEINIARSALAKISTRLLTPCGLRTLSSFDANYRGSYSGDEDERALSYHNGTVWPWLLGVYTESLMKNDVTLESLDMVINNLANMLGNYGVGTIGEIYSGDKPHYPCGCIAQAWSVAEVLRMLTLITD